MAVEGIHSDYAAWSALWQQSRDVVEGEHIVKQKGTQYLSRLSNMDDADYAAYLQGARFYNATGRTVQGLLGAAFRVPPVVTVPSVMEDWLEDITLSGLPFDTLLKKDMEDKLQTGRYGFRVDMMEDGGRPYLAYYSAENITNWREEVVDGHRVLTLVVLREAELIEGKDEFMYEEKEVYHVLDLDENNLCRVRKFRQASMSKEWMVELMPPPTRTGAPLTFIPFVFDGVTDVTPSCEKPPLLDLVSVNLGHYRLTADYYDAILFTSKPQPWVSGLTQQQELRIGSRNAWLLPPGATTGYLEYSGAGITDIRQALMDDESRMARLGAAVLEEPKAGVESAETSRINQSGKTSLLSSLTTTTGQAATMALRMMAWWGRLTESLDDPDITVQMNTDFIEARLTPMDLLSLVQSWQARGISRDTMTHNVKRGGLLPEGRTVEDEMALVDSESPPMPSGPPDNLDQPPVVEQEAA